LDEAVVSVLDQTFTDFEILVVNDGSTDPATRELLADYRRPRTRVIHTVNRGVAAARNRGISEAIGEYILPLDADDRIGPDYMRQAVEVLDARANSGIVYCGAELFGELNGRWQLPEFSSPHQLLDNLIFSAAFFRRADWQAVDGYAEMLAGWEDWDFWNCLLGLGREVVRLPGTQFFYRILRGSRERSLGRLAKCSLVLGMLCRHRQLYRHHVGDILRILLAGDRQRPGLIKVI
jgi:glycosyltransferase involved in cell wall biosynthesis